MLQMGRVFVKSAVTAVSLVCVFVITAPAEAQAPAPAPAKPAAPAAAAPAGADTAAKAAAAAAAAPAAAAPAPAATAPKTLSDAERAQMRAAIERELKTIADSLALSPEQRTKAQPILLDHGYKLKQLRDKYAAMEKTPANNQALTKEVQVLRDAADLKLAQIFTGEQMTGYKRMRDSSLAKLRTKVGVSPASAVPDTVARAAVDTSAAARAMATPDTTKKAAPADTTKKK